MEAFLGEGEHSQPQHGEGFPKDKANGSPSPHRVLSHRPRGLSCCSRPPQHRLFTWHSGSGTAAGICTRSCRSAAVPTNRSSRFTRELRPPRRGTNGLKLAQSHHQGLTRSPYMFCGAGSSSGSTRLSRAPSSGSAASAPSGFSNPKCSTGVSQALRSLSLGSTKEGTEDQISSGQSQVAAAGGQGRAGDTGGHQAMPANRTRRANTGLPKPQGSSTPVPPSRVRLTGG